MFANLDASDVDVSLQAGCQYLLVVSDEISARATRNGVPKYSFQAVNRMIDSSTPWRSKQQSSSEWILCFLVKNKSRFGPTCLRVASAARQDEVGRHRSEPQTLSAHWNAQCQIWQAEADKSRPRELLLDVEEGVIGAVPQSGQGWGKRYCRVWPSRAIWGFA